MSIGTQIKQTRLKKGLSAETLATRIGISRSYLTLIENNQRYLPKSLVKLLARAFKLSPQVIYQWYVDQELSRAGVDPQEYADTKFRQIFDSLNDAVAEMDMAGRITKINKRLEEMFGWDRSEIIGKPFWKIGFHIPRDFSELIRAFKQFALKRRVFDLIELTAKTKTGEILRVEVSSKLFRRNNRWRTLSVVRDITNRQQSPGRRQAQKIRWEILNQLED